MPGRTRAVRGASRRRLRRPCPRARPPLLAPRRPRLVTAHSCGNGTTSASPGPTLAWVSSPTAASSARRPSAPGAMPPSLGAAHHASATSRRRRRSRRCASSSERTPCRRGGTGGRAGAARASAGRRGGGNAGAARGLLPLAGCGPLPPAAAHSADTARPHLHSQEHCRVCGRRRADRLQRRHLRLPHPPHQAALGRRAAGNLGQRPGQLRSRAAVCGGRPDAQGERHARHAPAIVPQHPSGLTVRRRVRAWARRRRVGACAARRCCLLLLLLRSSSYCLQLRRRQPRGLSCRRRDAGVGCRRRRRDGDAAAGRLARRAAASIGEHALRGGGQAGADCRH